MTRHRLMLTVALTVAVAIAPGGTAWGEGPAPKAARTTNQDEPINIEADRMRADDQKQVAEFEGRVVLTQGTFQLRADKLTVRKDGEGFEHGVAVGNPATFRQQREGTDEWIDGEARRIEYDGKLARVELFDGARVSRDQDEVRGNYIVYDTRSEVFRVQGGKQPSASPGREGRVRAVIQPKPKPGGTPAAAPLELKPAPRLDSPRGK
ncbi:MAG: lipopolysaccharide transport periplasmic protein LptA [Burkholderiales bacterium]|nr:lipopolysaccharide transport periplasmic protein LptA [Burkholderiales bacterium]